MMLNSLKEDLTKFANREKAKLLAGFFKTGKGQYAEGDIFLGITVPLQRSIAKKYKELKLAEISVLLKSKIHEERLVGLLILVEQFKEADEKLKSKIFNFYLDNIVGVNNWDLVDLSAPNIVGIYLINNRRHLPLLNKLVRSNNIWKRRIAVLATCPFIKQKKFDPTIKISEILLSDKHDLIHKAVGWMLREVGKADEKALDDFLIKHHKIMPKTMLRYAIEKMDEEKRKRYLKGF